MESNNNNFRDNYFSINVSKYGNNFIKTKPAKDIQRDAKKKIFKDMVYGNINYDEYGSYFQDANFLDNLIAQANTLYIENMMVAQALYEYTMNHSGDANIERLRIRYFNASAVFSIIRDQLSNIKANNMDIQFLVNIAPMVYNLKNDFSELY